MLAFFRHLANTWYARVLLAALAASFVAWGVSSRVGSLGGDATLASVGGTDITPQQFQQELQVGLRRAMQRYPDPAAAPPDLRQKVAQETMERLVTQATVDHAVQRLGLEVPRAARDAEVMSMPAFQGSGGNFDRAVYMSVLQSNNLSEAKFLHEIGQDIAKNQLLGAITANVSASGVLTGLVYDFFNEKRQADIVTLRFDAAALPADPGDAALHRYYDNNLARFTSPEYRRVKAVILSAATIGRGLPVSDAEMHAWFDRHKADFDSQETRSVQVITASSESVAQSLAAQWKSGTGWDAIQAAAKTAGATGASLDDSTKAGIPSPELAKAAFDAPADVVTGPVKEALGYQLVKVTKITAARNPSFESLRDTIRPRVGEEKAVDMVDAKAEKLQDLFAGGSHIDEVPADLGAAGVEGTLDEQGNTPDGTPAPLPAAGALREAIVGQAFKAAPHDSLQLLEGPEHAWYAVQVDSITKPAAKPFDQVRTEVLSDWQHEQQHHVQEAAAAKIVSVVKSGQTLQQAAWGSGLQVVRTPDLRRNHPAPKYPAQLTFAVFNLKPGEAQMLQTADGFMVASLAGITKADPKTDASGVTDIRNGLKQALTQDYLTLYSNALRHQARTTVNQAMYGKLVLQPGE